MYHYSDLTPPPHPQKKKLKFLNIFWKFLFKIILLIIALKAMINNNLNNLIANKYCKYRNIN